MLDAHAPTWLPIDYISGNRLIIEPEHGAIHAGTHFTLTYNKAVNVAGSVSTVYFTTPATASAQYVHFVCGVEADKAVSWTLSRAASASGGSALTAYNNNLNSSNTNPLTITGSVTVTTYGTALETHLIGSSGTPASATGGGVTQRNEWLLEPGTAYMITVTTVSASTNTVINMPYYYRTRTA